MWSEAPERVFLAPYFAEVQPVGIDVLDSAQVSLFDQLSQPGHGRMVFEKVPDHENAPVAVR